MAAECVVFSACNTRDGTLTEEGLLDFSWACLAQGVPNMIVSLYKVPDHQTALLMENFYNNYSTHKNVPFGLQQSICKNLKEKRDKGIPINIFSYGGFVCVGL